MRSRGRIIRGVAALALVAGGMVVTTTAEAPAPAAAADCTVTPELVNPCRPWLGVVAGSYPGTSSGVRAQYEAHEARIW